MLTWISEKGAKWVIYIFGAGIVIGLLSLGQTNLDGDRMPPVAKVNGKAVTAAEFKQAYEAALAQYANADIGEEARAQLRSQILDQQIRAVLTGDQIRAAEVRATVAEMKNDLLNNPPESWKSAEIFQTDSAFDMEKWRRFVSTDSVYDFPFMLGYEQYLKNEKIPAMQLQAFVEAGYHYTDAEAKFNVVRRENRMNVDVVSAPVDSFPVEGTVSDEELRRLYEAQPDSFWAPRLMAKFAMVALPVVPSDLDVENARKILDWIRGQMEDGASFEALASEHSEDAGSKANGGSLGGYQPLDRWVAEFAAAARSLEPGQVSDPVRTSFGWHLIRCNGKKSENGEELYDLSHILVKIAAGNETLDSLRRVLQAVRTAVVEDGKDFDEAVQAAGLTATETPWLLRGQPVPGVGAVPGLASWGFGKKTREKVSQINDNDSWMTLFSRKAVLEAGERDFSLAEAKLRERAALEAREKAAEAYLKAK
ncbi:MAG: peptidylprolyl isomerase, partial [Fibrobacterales bacterium]|nr:peptidylprolyl isomerase [Fibrobacterales bacterium]